MISNYEVAQDLSQDELHIVYRGRRKSDQKPVLLKTLRQGAPAELLEREFNLLRELAMEGLPTPIELTQLEAGLCLVIEDGGGMAPAQSPLSGRSGRDTFFKIASKVSGILDELHRRDVIHRNINPRNIWFNPETGEVWLGGLALAVRATGEVLASPPSELLRSSLAYISPEQTGRMNRALDYRTDLYSLGATLYELLTGGPPFSSDDALEIIHSHIARAPIAPSDVNPDIPEQLSRIVMKLLSKTAEERYQSASGLRDDLDACAREWTAHGRIEPFDLGRSDVLDRFLIPQQLYGREKDVEDLLAAFDRMCEGRAAMMLVAGYSGIGKTSLIQELYKPIVRQRGYFASGKFDQVVRGIPFGALIQALRGLVRQLLSESEERLEQWRARLTEALGANGGVIAEVIPEIELIIGEQPAPPALGAAEAHNRFQLVFQNFVGALARQEHPLVIFLDDLQWSDPATLSLLQPLLTSPNIRHLFLMGACRDNEVDAAHPLVRTLGDLESAGVELSRVTLKPLQLPDLTRFISDALQSDPAEATSLARLVWEKTAGNPFFVIQFLKSLKQNGFLEFDYARRGWTYRLDEIVDAAMTDNVIDLMTDKIRRLSQQTQQYLTLASCIGNPFDLQTLAVVSEKTAKESASDLEEAINEGLIVPSAAFYSADDDNYESPPSAAAYSFLHDRVRQAAYDLIPAEKRRFIHLTIGRLLREKAESDGSDDKIFDMVHHLNLGGDLVSEDFERLELARLNLIAGRRAKSSTAYEAALDYLKSGIRLLDDEKWESNYDLAFELYLEAAECHNLCGEFDEAEAKLETLLDRARTNLDKAKALSLRIIQRESLSRYEEAIASAREALGLFGVHFPHSAEEQEAAIDREVESIQTLLGDRRIDQLADLPVMTDSDIRMVMSLLTTIWSSVYISGKPVLTRLISATMVRLSLVHGNCEESAYGYATHAVTAGPVREDYESAYEFGLLALRINEGFNDSRRRAKIYQQFHAHANLWRRPLQTCIPYAREASRSGFETGDFSYGIYGAFTESWVAIAITQDLAQFIRDYSPNLALFEKYKASSVGDAQRALLNWARALQGETHSPTSLSYEGFDEEAYVAAYGGNPFFLICQNVVKLQLCYLFGDYAKALETARIGRDIIHHLEGTIWPVLFEFWNGLTLAANFTAASESDREQYLEEMQRARKRFSVLADNCPENYLCQCLLLSAEIERITGRELAAAELYERAVEYSRAIGAVQYEALSNELSAGFWLGRGQETIATMFLANARDNYANWGARAKVADLERKHARLLGRETERRERFSPESAAAGISRISRNEAGSLDLVSVMKAAQAIAGEIELENLLAKLMRIVIENAGAERGSLILVHDGGLFVHASGSLDTAEVKVHDAIPLDQSPDLPASIVHYVRRTSENLVLSDPVTDDRYGADPYIQKRRPRSVMCIPALNQGNSIGILYLENNMLSSAFTPERIMICRMLASQAAISLENARLFNNIRQEALQRRTAEETLRSITEGTAAVTGHDFFASLVRHLADALQVRYAFVTECREREKTKARTLAFWMGDRLADNVTYDIAETPCLKVLAGETCFYPAGVQQLFPNDKDLVDLSAVGYLGIPLCSAAGAVIGHLAILDDKPMIKTEHALSLINIFAARAGAELERQHAEEDLRAAMAEVELLKNRLHAENIYLQEEIRSEHNFEDIVGSSPALIEVLQQVERVAPTDATILILGETGTGKELIARAIHDRSNRKDRPLVKVNCGAISAGLVESELFGHVKGAFTGALDKRTGRFELADGGTLFLDEVGELPLETQVKLLRVLQEGEFEPVGSSKTLKVDVRIIAATNRNLEDEIKAGRFRADLFYRLNVLALNNPPLRERKSDIPQLAMFFLSRFSRRFGRTIEGISQDTIELMMNYDWPGNIRELQNLIERGVALSSGSALTIEPGLLRSAKQIETEPFAITQQGNASSSSSAPRPVIASSATSGPASLDELQRRHIMNVLSQTNWVIEGENGAAKLLNLHPNTLRSRLKKMGIQRPK